MKINKQQFKDIIEEVKALYEAPAAAAGSLQPRARPAAPAATAATIVTTIEQQ